VWEELAVGKFGRQHFEAVYTCVDDANNIPWRERLRMRVLLQPDAEFERKSLDDFKLVTTVQFPGALFEGGPSYTCVTSVTNSSGEGNSAGVINAEMELTPKCVISNLALYEALLPEGAVSELHDFADTLSDEAKEVINKSIQSLMVSVCASCTVDIHLLDVQTGQMLDIGTEFHLKADGLPHEAVHVEGGWAMPLEICTWLSIDERDGRLTTAYHCHTYVSSAFPDLHMHFNALFSSGR
jgi:hypothetical protein